MEKPVTRGRTEVRCVSLTCVLLKGSRAKNCLAASQAAFQLGINEQQSPLPVALVHLSEADLAATAARQADMMKYQTIVVTPILPYFYLFFCFGSTLNNVHTEIGGQCKPY